MIRLAPYIAQRASLSRRQAEAAIVQGRVSRHAQPITSFYTDCLDGLALDGVLLQDPPPAKAWAYHKPAGQLVTRYDPQGRPTVWSTLRRWIPDGPLVCVGRLDAASEGLLIVTNHPPLAHLLETSRLPRVYRVWVAGAFTPKNNALLRKGIVVDDIQYRPIRVVIEKASATGSQLSVTLIEGKKREIRVVMEALGHPVTRLLRLSFGPWSLHDRGEEQLAELPSSDIESMLSSVTASPSSSTTRKPWQETTGLSVASRASGAGTGATRRPAWSAQSAAMRSSKDPSAKPATPSGSKPSNHSAAKSSLWAEKSGSSRSSFRGLTTSSTARPSTRSPARSPYQASPSNTAPRPTSPFARNKIKPNNPLNPASKHLNAAVPPSTREKLSLNPTQTNKNKN